MTRRIATRNGKPAWVSAPPRRRQSDYAKPAPPAQVSIIKRILGVVK